MAVDLTSDALTTLDTVKDELGISVSTYDDTLKRLINAVSRRIRSYCERVFYFEEDVEESVAGFGDTKLVVSRRPIVEISSITYDGETVSSDDYSIHSDEAGIIYRETGWAWTARLLKNVTADPKPGTEQKLFVVTYDAGWVTPQQVVDDPTLTRTLPEDLEDACLMAVTSRYQSKGQDLLIKSEKSLNYSVTYDGGRDILPAGVKEMLNPYRSVW